MYEVHSKNDAMAGATLVVRVPENEIDRKALLTLETNQPEFILPFKHRAIDGEYEFTYQLGTRSKFSYMSGTRTVNEYVDLWISMLQPLLDCGDWFMNRYSFVLSAEYLYIDKHSKKISYIYIPSLRPCSDDRSIKDMVSSVANSNRVDNDRLENQVLRALPEFNLVQFLDMIRQHKAGGVKESVVGHVPVVHDVPPQLTPQSMPVHEPIKPAEPVKPPGGGGLFEGEFDIAFSGDEQKDDKPKKSGFLGFGGKKKEPKEPKEKSGLFGKKKPQQPEGILFDPAGENVAPLTPQPIQPIPIYHPEPPDDGHTVIDETGSPTPSNNSARFRYVGGGSHPRIIEVTVQDGRAFTIGRFDVSVGRKQCDFEFHERTKAVSRRHAAIERRDGGYFLVDVNSQGGTFINGSKITPGSAYKLERGLRVSFGFSGADYVWEE